MREAVNDFFDTPNNKNTGNEYHFLQGYFGVLFCSYSPVEKKGEKGPNINGGIGNDS